MIGLQCEDATTQTCEISKPGELSLALNPNLISFPFPQPN